VKRYRFRLAAVLRVRRLQEDLAASRLRDANRHVVEAGRLVALRQTHYDELPPASGGNVELHLASRQRLDHAAAAIERAGEARRAARAEADEARDSWHSAATRVSTLEHLDGERRVEHAREVAREEEREVDQVVMGRARRRLGPGSVPQ
jgi:flagellar protein FliJ